MKAGEGGGVRTIRGWDEEFGIACYEKAGVVYQRARSWDVTRRLMDSAARTRAALQRDREQIDSLAREE